MGKRALLLLLLSASACQRNHGYPWPQIEGARTLILLALEDGPDGGADTVHFAQLAAADAPPSGFNFFDRGISRYLAYGYACPPEQLGLEPGMLESVPERERARPLTRPPRIAELDPAEDEPIWKAPATPPARYYTALDSLPEQTGDDCSRLSLSLRAAAAPVPFEAGGSVMPRYLTPAGDGSALLGTLGGKSFRIGADGEPHAFRFPGLDRALLAVAPRGEGGFWLFDERGSLWQGPLEGPFVELAATSSSPGRLAALAPSLAGEPEEVFIMSSDRVFRRWDGTRLTQIATGMPHDYTYRIEEARLDIPVPFVPTVIRTGPSQAVTFGLGLFDDAIVRYDHGQVDQDRLPDGGQLISIGVHPTLGTFASTIGAVYQLQNGKWTRLSDGAEVLFMFLLRPEGAGMLISGFDNGGGRVSGYAKETGRCDNRDGPSLVAGAALDAERRVFVSMQVTAPTYDITNGLAQVLRYDIARPFSACSSAD